MAVFSLREVKALQVKNVADDDFQSWSESNNYGYIMGGYFQFNTHTNTIRRLDFSSETVSLPGNNLPEAKKKSVGTSNSLYGYIAGGGSFTPPAIYYNTINRLDFSSEVISSPGNNLPAEKFNLAEVSNNLYGYLASGSNVPPSPSENTVFRLDFSNETISTPGKNLPSGRFASSGVSIISYGYFAGGGDAAQTISRLDFTNETISDPGNNLSFNRIRLASVSSSSYGYFGGGDIYPGSPPVLYYSIIERLDFSNEMVSSPGKNLSIEVTNMSGVSSNSFGYYCGGSNNLNVAINTIRKLDFFNETVSNSGQNLPTITDGAASVSGGTSIYRSKGFKTYGYIAPHFNSTSYIRLDLSTESSQLLNASNTSTAYGRGTVSNNYYGYFAGGLTPAPATISTINRFDFSNETETNPGNTLLGIGYFVSTNVMNNNYGYFCGGQFPASEERSDVTRMDFSTEVVADTGKDLPFKGRYRQNFSAGSYGYFMGGYFYDAPGDDWFTTLSRLDFTSETVSVVGTIGPTTCDGRTAVQNNLNGYVCGGNFPHINTVYRMEFATENVSTPGNNLPTTLSSSAALSSDYYGYIVGGDIPGNNSNILRLDFSSEIVSDNLNNIPVSIANNNGVTN